MALEKKKNLYINITGLKSSGKSALIERIHTGKFVEDTAAAIPVAPEDYFSKKRASRISREVEGKTRDVKMWENGFDFMLWGRTTLNATDRYREVTVHFVCFPVNEPQALEELVKTWQQKTARPSDFTDTSANRILVGTKVDLRDESQPDYDPSKFVPTKRGASIASEYGFFGYVEISSKSGKGIEDLISAAWKSIGCPPTPSRELSESCIIA